MLHLSSLSFFTCHKRILTYSTSGEMREPPCPPPRRGRTHFHGTRIVHDLGRIVSYGGESLEVLRQFLISLSVPARRNDYYLCYIIYHMQFQALLKSKTPMEVILGILFVFFLFYPMIIHEPIASLVESTLGMVFLLSISTLLFLYAHIILAILFIIVAYELIRRSSKTTGRSTFLQFSPTQHKLDQHIAHMNSPKIITLEEDTVSKMAPIGANEYVESSFKPVFDNDHNAFNIV